MHSSPENNEADPNGFGEFLIRLKDESRTYVNFNGILEKAERDGYIGLIQTTLDKILRDEMSFAIFGRLTRVVSHKTKKQKSDHQKVASDQSLRF